MVTTPSPVDVPHGASLAVERHRGLAVLDRVGANDHRARVGVEIRRLEPDIEGEGGAAGHMDGRGVGKAGIVEADVVDHDEVTRGIGDEDLLLRLVSRHNAVEYRRM